MSTPDALSELAFVMSADYHIVRRRRIAPMNTLFADTLKKLERKKVFRRVSWQTG